ncbi:MAG: DUF4870 domain-containing protein [Opitutae bacterium]
MEFSQSAYHKPDNPAPQKMHWGMNEKSFCMLLHLSQLAGMVLPGAGLVLPVVMWATEKDNSPLIDEQGKVVLNWMISSLLYGFVAGLLCFFLVKLQQELGRTERFNAFLRLGSGNTIFDQPL